MGQNLNTRIETFSPLCRICCIAIEDEHHCLFSCTWTAKIWEDFKMYPKWSPAVELPTKLQWLFVNTPTELQSLFSIILWNIWKERCRFVLEDTTMPPNGDKIISSSRALYAALATVKEANGIGAWRQTTTNCTWNPPRPPFSSISVDAAFGDDGQRRSGLVWRDNSGYVLWTESSTLPSRVDVLHGELLAIRNGLRFAQKRALEYIQIWSDCLNAVNLISAHDNSLHPLHQLALECKILKDAFPVCEILFTRRERNMAAHHVANLGLNYSSSFTWENNPPSIVLDCALTDIA